MTSQKRTKKSSTKTITEDENLKNLNHTATCVRELKTKIRKETAKEILMEIKDRSIWFIENPIQKDHFSEQMQELSKEYGVELNEIKTLFIRYILTILKK